MERSISSIGKRHKVVDGEPNHVDRLSDLPDEIICRHILSFLPTRRSMQTSILSKRWKTLWAHVPVLVFQRGDVRTNTTTTFSGIICTVLLGHKAQTLYTCRLTYMGPTGDPCKLQTCIATVVERNVQNLYLSLGVEVPSCLLTCKTLVDLTLYKLVSIPSTAPISLPNLKKLLLHRLDCEVDFTRLLFGCPVLEELGIHGIPCTDPRGCYVSSPTLKRLTISYMLDSSMFRNPDYMVKINTPALSFLKLTDRSSKHFSILLCTSLVEADIFFDFFCCESDGFYRGCVFKFLDSIPNVKCLSISGYRGKIWDGPMRGSFAKFDNLTKLEFRANWFLLTTFIERANNIKVLTIIEFPWHSKQWKDPVEERCACLLRSLRTVRIDHFGCTEQGFNMVRYILRNARVLERMEINCRQLDVEKKFDAIRKISIFPRESNKCELHFS